MSDVREYLLLNPSEFDFFKCSDSEEFVKDHWAPLFICGQLL